MDTSTLHGKQDSGHTHTEPGHTGGMDIKDIVRKARQDAGLNQSELAKLAGVDSSTINNLESGKQRGLGGVLLIKLSKALGIEPAALISGAPAPAAPPQSSGHCSDVCDFLAELSPERAEWHRATIMAEAAAARLARAEAAIGKPPIRQSPPKSRHSA